MKKLTEYQKEFLLKTFFKINTNAIGWENIATKLLDTGKCIVAGTDCIWYGGIGNFIKTEETIDYIDCSLYTFDLNDFLKSAWYKEIIDLHLIELLEKKNKINKQFEELSYLNN